MPAIARDVTEDGVGVFHRFHEAWTSRNLPNVLSFVDPEIVARPLHRILFTGRSSTGRRGSRTGTAEMTEPWDRFEAVVEEAHPTPPARSGCCASSATAATTAPTPGSASCARCATGGSSR
jgi:hypothetical protein